MYASRRIDFRQIRAMFFSRLEKPRIPSEKGPSLTLAHVQHIDQQVCTKMQTCCQWLMAHMRRPGGALAEGLADGGLMN
jgi:hypothetical protein